MSKQGKPHQKRPSRRDSSAIENVLNDSIESDQRQAKRNVVGYIAGFVAQAQVKKKIRVVDEFELMPDGKRKTKDNPLISEKTIYGAKYYFFCVEHKPKVGVNGCESITDLVADEPIFTYKDPVCKVPGCAKPVLPLEKFLVIEVNQKQEAGITSELKGDLLDAVDRKEDRLEKIDAGLNIQTKSFEWKKQFELVQFLVDWKAELTVSANDGPKITAMSFKRSNLGLRSFAPAFVVQVADKCDLIESDLKDLGCYFDADFGSYVRKFPSIAELISFMRQFGGALRVEIMGKGQKHQVLPTITLSGGNWLQKWWEKSKAS